MFRPDRFLPFAWVVGVGLCSVSAAPAQDAGGSSAQALAAIGGEALDIAADKLNVDVSRAQAVLEGEVTVRLGDLTVECPRVDIRYDQAPIVQWAKGTGGVRARFKDIEARASSVEVSIGAQQMRLSGEVLLKRGRGWIRAGHATIDLGTRKVTLDDVKGSIPVETPAR